MDDFQSGLRAHHSTETALIEIINDIPLNSDSGKISVLHTLTLGVKQLKIKSEIWGDSGDRP